MSAENQPQSQAQPQNLEPEPQHLEPQQRSPAIIEPDVGFRFDNVVITRNTDCDRTIKAITIPPLPARKYPDYSTAIVRCR